MESIIIEARPSAFPSVFIFKSGVWSIQLQQRVAVFFETVEDLAESLLVDSPNHSSADGSVQGIPRQDLWPDSFILKHNRNTDTIDNSLR